MAEPPAGTAAGGPLRSADLWARSLTASVAIELSIDEEA